MLDFSFFDEVRHRANRFFDRHIGVDTVLVEQVDAVDAEAFQAALDRSLCIGSRTVDTNNLVTVETEAEFGSDHQPIALALDRFADQFFILEWAVNLRSIEKGDAKVDGAVDRLDRFIGIGSLTIQDVAAFDHRHAADTDGGNLQAMTEIAIFHDCSPS